MPACAHKGSSQRSDKLSTCGLCMCFDKIQRKAIHAKDRVHNRACTPLWRMKQDHFTTAAESASARNRQRDGVQGSDKRSMRGLCMCFDKIQRKAIHAKDRVHNRACTPSWRMKQDHFAIAAESASARNRQRDGVQGYGKRSMRGLCMCFENVQSKAIHAKKSACKKACMYALMAYKEDLSAQLQNALRSCK